MIIQFITYLIYKIYNSFKWFQNCWRVFSRFFCSFVSFEENEKKTLFKSYTIILIKILIFVFKIYHYILLYFFNWYMLVNNKFKIKWDIVYDSIEWIVILCSEIYFLLFSSLKIHTIIYTNYIIFEFFYLQNLKMLIYSKIYICTYTVFHKNIQILLSI